MFLHFYINFENINRSVMPALIVDERIHCSYGYEVDCCIQSYLIQVTIEYV